MTAPTIRLKHETRTYTLLDAPKVEQVMGNGRRRITPDEMAVTDYGDQSGYVRLDGRSVRRDGSLGPRRSVGGQSVGGGISQPKCRCGQ